MRRFLIVGLCVGILLSFVTPVNAYYTNMNASVVVGQNDFVSDVTGVTQSNFANTAIRGLFVDSRGRLLVADQSNNRVLVWNSVPTTNGKAADLVLGQPDFNQNTANNGGRSGSTMAAPFGIYSDGNRLFVNDATNRRVLIWNSFPTQNGQSADVVVGQPDMTSLVASTCTSGLFSSDEGLSVYNNRLIVGDRSLRRVQIWNSIPTTNGVSADVVIGQTSLSDCSFSGTISQRTFGGPRGIFVDSNGKLYVDDGSNRILIYNSIPTTDFAPADVVVGQSDFTSSAAGLSPSSLSIPISIFSNGKRLYIADNNNNRVLIYNNILTTNGASADLVLGQTSFTSSSTSGVSASSMSNPQVPFEYGDKLFVSEAGGDRIMIFNNIFSTPAMNINSPISVANKIRILGNVSLGERPTYKMQRVTASVNGENESEVTYLDGGRDNGAGNTLYEFYNDFLPTVRGGDQNNYTVAFRAQSFNAEEDKRFYFTPFSLDKITIESFPTLTFTVNQTFRDQLKNNLTKYQVWYKKDKDINWKLYIDNILASQENYGKIVVKGGTKLLPGKYQIQIRAINIMNHEQQSNSLNVKIVAPRR